MYTPSLNTRNRFTVILDLDEINLLLNYHIKACNKYTLLHAKMAASNDGRGPLKSRDHFDHIGGMCAYHSSSINILSLYRDRIKDVPLKHMDPLELP